MDPSLTIDSNARPIPFLHDPSIIPEEYNLQRIVAVATPFLALNPITSTVLTIGMGGVRTWHLLNDIHQSYTQGNWNSFALQNAQLALVVSSVALTLFFPTIGIIVITGVQLVPEIYQLGLHLYQGEYLESGKDLLGLGSTLLYIGSMVIGGPELLLLSLMAQGIKELGTSYKEFSNGRILEGVANMLLAAIRVQKAVPHAMLFHRNNFGKTVTVEVLDEILLTARTGDSPKVDLGKILEEGYYSSYIKRNNLSEKDLSYLIIKDLSFTECNFDQANFEGSIIENSQFRSCWMKNACFIDTVVQNTIFSQTKLNDAIFFKSSLSNVIFTKIDLDRACFNESTLKSVRYEDSILSETNFLQTKAEKTLLKNCDLTNTLLCDMKKTAQFQNCTDNVFTKPVVALSWNFRHQGSMASSTEKALREKNAITLRFDYHPDVDVDLLHKEATALLAEIEKDQNIGLSRLDEILKRASIDSEIAKLQATAKTISENADAFMFPGGVDIEPEFYGEKNISSYPESDYRRTLLESAIFKGGYESHKPIMGICRGSQFGNVYLGGTLHQNVEGHLGQILTMKPVITGREELDAFVQNLFGEGIQGYSAHHQASKDIGKGVHVVLSTDGIPKLILSEDKHVILSQFHPETYVELKKWHEEGWDRKLKEMLDRINDTLKEVRQDPTLSPEDALEKEKDLLQGKKELEAMLARFQEYIASSETHEKMFELFLDQIRTRRS